MNREQRKAALKKIFSDAVVEAKKQELIDKMYAGHFTVHVNNGGTTEVDCFERIK
jgi:hypothetical protein